jgi:uncharacterized metal-binding protein YceD (DUF177 family)
MTGSGSDAEFSRMVKARHLPAGPLELEADANERAALAERFDIGAVERLVATVSLAPDNDAVLATGALVADLVQACAVSGEDFPVHIEEPLAMRFARTARPAADDEIEFSADDPDEIEFDGETFDLGEAVAQTLALAIDPYATSPDADRARREGGLLGEAEAGPFAALAVLKKS